MHSPNLDAIWESFVRIGPCRESTFAAAHHVRVLRQTVAPAIDQVRRSGLADWFHLLIHDDGTFNVQAPPRGDALWHLRLSLRQAARPADLRAALPSSFEATRPVPRSQLDFIPGLDALLLKSADTADSWAILGMQTEWLLQALALYREEAEPVAICWELRQYHHLLENAVFPPVRQPGVRLTQDSPPEVRT